MRQNQMSVWPILILSAIVSLGLSLAKVANLAHKKASESQCYGVLKGAIYVNLLNFRAYNGKYPSAANPESNNKILHSWRPQIYLLASNPPQIEYDLKHSWDEPANLKAVHHAPLMFVCPNNQAEPFRFTNYVAVIDHGVSTLERASNIPEGLPKEAKQPLIIEYPNSDILWTEPRDLDATELHKLTEGNDPGGLGVLFADGSYRRMKRAEVLKLFGR